MASTTAKRSHYDVLGLRPSATNDEIARAFAREMGAFRPHSITGFAEVTVAHEVLRDPARRREYDVSIGLVREKPKQLLAWSAAGHATFSVSAFASRPQPPAGPIAAVSPPPPEPSPSPPPVQQQPSGEASPFIAAALRELARPEPLHEAARVPWPQPEPPAQAQAPAEEDYPPALYERLGEDEEGSIRWKPAAIIGGVLLVGVVIIGAWAGWDPAGGSQSKSAVNVALPPSTTFSVGDPEAAAEAPAVEQAQPVQPRQAARAAAPVERTRSTARLAGLERQIAALPQPEAATPEVAEAAPAAETAPASAVAASMPLSNGVIARTIHRIGYPCGQVTSTAPSGAAGVFTVTCTSGHSYRAIPVHGRYRFSRRG
jgi:hypothetical protein